jgi:quercetin dioxygenase-like cupin family protein
MSDHQYLVHTDHDAFAALAADQRFSQKMLGRATGGAAVAVNLIRTPPGQGSPEGLHTHAFEQVFYVLSGTMNIEIDGETFQAPKGSLVRFPEGVPHRNWNDADGEESLHLAINVPAPEPGRPAAEPVVR